MQFIEAIILGLVQGLTEFLPISSSAHLRIVGEFLPSATDPGATFTAITQIGTELAVLLYFWNDITRIIGRWFRAVFGGSRARRPRSSADAGASARDAVHSGGARHATRPGATAIAPGDPDVRMGWLIIIGTIPIVVVGYLAQESIRSVFRSLWLVAIVLIVFGILLGIADRYGKRDRDLDDLTYPHGLWFGLAQTLALIPGVSRSGATTTMGRALGYNRPAAARYAFLLAVPAVFGSGLYELVNSVKEPAGYYGYAETAVATVVAFVVGYAVIAFLMRYIQRGSFMPFVVYRVLLGAVLLVLLSTGVLQPL
ncbi:undecaprenyl-diphosphate phosphatase [Ruicaihuangia caeni]|uniref:Undecaprenyl-diphosphatase n=1 Tax=Ruicaihuangia caeni TaxID=3042517 RepID=A0AAW6T417_9MICO|nr:undecaprenyl-diphosphate phosphatase [Klugiella sp. YN-L-19]MDI2098189.1 undecaprenyl-diphosphate phosphatase [Klugiella sp. YN-L-19]